jgi:hypothetical protein
VVVAKKRIGHIEHLVAPTKKDGLLDLALEVQVLL